MVLLLVAAMMSGLTIGLISLDLNNLAILKSSGTPTQRKYAAIVEPIRKNGHLLLCTLLILNMLATETLPIVLDDILGGGIAAIVVATALIVLFGEIIPQAICSKHALAIGAHSAWLVRILMFITFPISWPISKFLTWLIGDHEGVVYRRAELKELVSLHGPKNVGELTSDEVTIIASVLDLRGKKVADVMTPLDDVFMLDIDTVLDAAALRLIYAAGYSRIPVYVHGDRTSIIGVLLVKTLITIDCTKKLRIRDVRDQLVVGIQYFDSKASLFAVLNEFQTGKGHLGVVADHLIKEDTLEHSRLVVTGILTLEDVVEELIGEEIVDETDLFIDLKSKQQVTRPRGFQRSPVSPNGRDHFTKRSFRNASRGLIRKPVKFESHYGLLTHRWSGYSTWKESAKSPPEDEVKLTVETTVKEEEEQEEPQGELDALIPKDK